MLLKRKRQHMGENLQATALSKAAHPKNTKWAAKRKGSAAEPEPVEGHGGTPPAQPAWPVEPPPPSKGRRTAPDGGRPDSGRLRCAFPGHGGEREARSCKACAVLHVAACAAQVAPAAGREGWAFEVLRRVARTPSGTYWCPQCLQETLLDRPEQLGALVGMVRLAEAGTADAEAAIRGRLARLFAQTTKCARAAHAAARNDGLCRCEAQLIWRSCAACGAARAYPYAGLD